MTSLHGRALLSIVAIVFFACATGPKPVYPPMEGNWMYDYGASVDQNGELPQIPQEWQSELKRDEDETRDRLMVLMNPPELLAIERAGKRLVIQGGGRFERVYFIDGTSPSPGVAVSISARSIVAVHTEPEMTMSETWEVSADRSTLSLAIRAESRKLPKPLELRRIYRSSRSF
jgi:hypothetical protein